MDVDIRICIFTADKNCIRARISNTFAVMGPSKISRILRAMTLLQLPNIRCQ
jgi:hypothetical protein